MARANAVVGFTVVDNFETVNTGALNAQNGWTTTTGITVVTDPLNAGNQVVRMNGAEQNGYKLLPGTVASTGSGTLFMRILRDGAADGFGGLSDESAPVTWDGYETQFGATNNEPNNFRVRDGSTFDSLESQFEPNTWYCVWITIDSFANQYEAHVQGGIYENRTQLLIGAQSIFAFRNGRGNDLSTFLMRMGNPTPSSLYLDDIYIEVDGISFDTPNGSCGEPTGFQPIDTFETLATGALSNQNSWTATSGINVTSDPLNAGNNALQMNGTDQNAYKALPKSMSDSDIGTLYMRMMHDGATDGFGGLSDEVAPTAWGDFETYAGATNRDPNRFRVIDGGEGNTLDSQFEPNIWYCVWMNVNNATDQYEVYVQGGAYAARSKLMAGDQETFSFRNGTTSPLTTFQARMGTGTANSMYIDDIYIDASNTNFDTPGGTCEYVAPQSEDNLSFVPGTNIGPVVDETLDEIWSIATRNNIDNLIFGTSPDTNEDISATWRGLYDSSMLYLLIEVIDDDLQNDSGNSYWLDDGVEIYLDGTIVAK